MIRLPSPVESSEHTHPTNSYPPIGGDPAAGRPSVAPSSRSPPVKMWPQFFCAFCCCLGGVMMGTTIGWSAPAIYQLRDNSSTEHEFDVTDDDANWIGSLMPAGALLGSAFGGWVADRQGRKGGMYLSAAFFLAGYLFLICSGRVWHLYAGRLLSGVGSGLVTTSSPTYVAEIASPGVRGVLGSGFQVCVTLGVGYVAALGYATTWRWMSVACVALIVVWCVVLLAIPESPTYLLAKKDFAGGRASLQFLRGSVYVENELSEVQGAIEEANFRTAAPRDLLRRENFRPLLIAFLLMFGQQFSGINAVIFNSVAIFDAADTPLNSYVENIIVAAVQIVFTVVGCLIIDKAGRRVLLLVSDALMCVTISGLGAYFYVYAHDPEEASKIGLLPVLCLSLYVMAFSLAFGAIPWLMTSEIMAPEMKAMSVSLASASNWIMAFFVTRFYGDASRAIGDSWTFWGFAMFLVFTFVGILLFVPETKGRSLEEIRAMFEERQRCPDDRGLVIDNEVVATFEDDADDQNLPPDSVQNAAA